MFGKRNKVGSPVGEQMERFIGEHHVMTLATAGVDGVPYCCNLFFARPAGENIFVFTSESKTRHAAEMDGCGLVAASIVLETKKVGLVRGLQIQGRATRAGGDPLEAIARSAYLKKFPYAALAPLELWILRPTFMKLTDNRLGFGKKVIWNG